MFGSKHKEARREDVSIFIGWEQRKKRGEYGFMGQAGRKRKRGGKRRRENEKGRRGGEGGRRGKKRGQEREREKRMRM